jgi:hypothetical protein
MTLRLNLGSYLQRHQITAYRLVNEVRGRVAPNTVYTLARKPAQRIDLDTVSQLLSALERLTGEKVGLMDVVDEWEQPQAVKSEPPTLESLLAHLPTTDPSEFPLFKRNLKRQPVLLGQGPTITEMISEGRDHP